MYRPCYAPVFTARSGVDCTMLRLQLGLLLVFLIILYALTFGSRGIRCLILQTAYRINHCSEGNDDPTIDIGFSLDRWISETPAVREALIWRPDGDTAISYRNWSRADKRYLQTLYNSLKTEGQVDLLLEPPIFDFSFIDEGRGDRGNRIFEIGYDAGLAKTTFFAHVAQSLCVEIQEQVPWRLVDLSEDHLAFLLDSRHMYSWSNRLAAHSLEVSQGKATPGDPGRVFQFLESEGIIADSERNTVLAILEWCRNLSHDGGELGPDGETIILMPGSRDGNEYHWQYEGYQPVERTIAGTIRTGSSSPRHWTHGCQGTTGFLRCVLRTINIPVARADGCGHAIPHFMNDRSFISHGDDPYNQKMKNWTPRIAMSSILLRDDRLPGFFTNCDHVGRGVTEAIARLLPDQIIEWYCEDESAGIAREDGQVLAFLRRDNLNDSYLESINFWERLQDAIDRRGGCDGLI